MPIDPIDPNNTNIQDNPVSEPVNMPPEALESPINADIPVSLNNDNPENEPISTPSPQEPKAPENPVSSSAESESVEANKPTAQIPVNEPLEYNSKSSFARQLLISARNAIQFRKRKKLDKVMSLFLKHSKITNDEVEKFLHVSDATATRYLSELEKEGKIKQNGKTGHMVSYSRI